jgi:hypothetical protein
MDDISAILETTGPDMGADVWPQAELVQVQIKGSPTYRSETDPGPMGVSPLVGVNRQAATETLPVLPACNQGVKTIASHQYRLIGVMNRSSRGKEVFAMATLGPYALVNGRPQRLKIDRARYLPFDPARLDLCIWADIKNKYAEHWVVKNDSKEVHNFHLHQAKFEVLDHDDGSRAFVASKASGPGAWHDNFPINPGGWVLLRVPFDRPEQAGRYMYHCHILEHEDKGMMSMIQVVDTSAEKQIAKAAQMSTAGADHALASYLASAPPWMKAAVCKPPR